MIISASRRTDIPACYSRWLLQRMEQGYVLVRHPMRYHQISRVSLSPSIVDGMVFWTKNPTPMLPYLDALGAYPYYFQFTLTAYGQDMETNIPSKNDVVIPAFRRLADKIGPHRLVWRYDPIILTANYTVEYHVHYFREIAKRLAGYTQKCVISFVDFYRNTQAQLSDLQVMPMAEMQMYELAGRLSEIARQYDLTLESCAEAIDLEPYGIRHGHCIDKSLLESLTGYPLKLFRDPHQRPACGCMESIDIGAYNTCTNGCRYCYANYIPSTVAKHSSMHDPMSPLLFGTVTAEDTITERTMVSLRKDQLDLF